MRIPKQIQLHGQTIKTVYEDNLIDKRDNVGEAQYRVNKIVLQTINKAVPRDLSQQKHWYCHELIHHILDHMGRHELNKEESFVDMFGHLLQQALSTAEY